MDLKETDILDNGIGKHWQPHHQKNSQFLYDGFAGLSAFVLAKNHGDGKMVMQLKGMSAQPNFGGFNAN